MEDCNDKIVDFRSSILSVKLVTISVRIFSMRIFISFKVIEEAPEPDHSWRCFRVLLSFGIISVRTPSVKQNGS